MPDWDAVFDDLYRLKTTREITFNEAALSGSDVVYPSSRFIPAGIRYVQVGFDPFRGILVPESRVEVIIWFRDWFGRNVDGATQAEMEDIVRRLRGAVKRGSPVMFSRFVVDGSQYTYSGHAIDQRPDGTPFAVIVTLKAA